MKNLLFLIFLIYGKPPKDYISNQNKLNLLTFTNNQKNSFFLTLQWCSLSKFYSISPSISTTKKIEINEKHNENCFRENIKNSLESFVTEKLDLLISRCVEREIEKLIDDKIGFKIVSDNFNPEKCINNITNDIKNLESNQKTNELDSINLNHCTDYIENLLLHYRGDRKTSKLFGILLNRICLNLKEISALSTRSDYERIKNIVSLFRELSENHYKIEPALFFKEYFSSNESKSLLNNSDQKLKSDSNIELGKQLTNAEIVNTANNSDQKLKSDGAIELGKKLTGAGIANAPNNSVQKLKLESDIELGKKHTNAIIRNTPNNSHVSNLNMQQINSKSIIKLLSNFMSTLIFIFEKMLNFALNENILSKPNHPLLCLKLFSDCNLLIHLFILMINSDQSKSANFYYFTLTMDKSVEKLFEHFNSLSASKKLEFLLDNKKEFQKIEKFNSSSLIGFEFWENVSKEQFLLCFANALTLASLDPFYWEPPFIEDQESLISPEYFVL